MDGVEIRDGLTLGLLSTLQLSKATACLVAALNLGFFTTPQLWEAVDGIVYSPDGQSLAGYSNDATIIWDIQTGGVIKKIMHRETYIGLTPVWSLDGQTIGILFKKEGTIKMVCTYNVTSGQESFSGALLGQLSDKLPLWAHGGTFWIMTTTKDTKGWTVDVLEVGTTLAKVKSLLFSFQLQPTIRAISSTTNRVSIERNFLYNPDSSGEALTSEQHLIFDICDSRILLQETCYYGHCAFSPDGEVFAAFDSHEDILHIWRYTSGYYTKWKEFQQAPMSLTISPTLSSILGHTYNLLHILHLDGALTANGKKPVATIHGQPLDAFPPDGTYIVTANCQESTITVTNLYSQNSSPSQLIDTGLEISAMVLTGNVLLVKGSGRIVAWLLTEEGVVDSISYDRRADHTSSLWSIPLDPTLWVSQQQQSGGCGNGCYLEFSVGNGVAMIRNLRDIFHIYHTRSGKILGLDGALQNLGCPWYRLHTSSWDECNLYHRDSHKHNRSPRCDWPISKDTLQGGWVKDPEGKHRIWLPARWRSEWNDVDWFEKVTALRLRTPTELVIIKF